MARRRNTRKPMPKLGELELSVLEHLWSTGDADVVETHTAVGRRRGITVNTVGSALERLYKKGLAERWKVSHAYRYEPTMDRPSFCAQRLLDAAGGMRALASDGLLSAFVDLLADTDEAALEQLQQLVAQKREGDKP